MTYLSAAVYAYDVVLACLALAAVAALLWGISLLPIPLAIVVGAGIIAYAIYRRAKSPMAASPPARWWCPATCHPRMAVIVCIAQ